MSSEFWNAPPARLETLCIHAGNSPDPTTGAIVPPIYQTATYVQDAVGVDKGYTYTRSGNPTVRALEQNLGALEGAESAVAFATGMAAITALILATVRQGERILVSEVVYGGTVRLLRNVLGPLGIRADFVDTRSLERVAQALRTPTALVLLETPANPTLRLCDVAGVACLAKEHGALLAVDNTFLTPVLQRCFELGADLTLYSTTKHIEGHNATVGGAVIARSAELTEKLRYISNAVGFPQSPFEAWLTLRGLKTLPLRLAEHSRKALAVAQYLEAHPLVERVHYPWLASHPQHELALRQQAAGGGILAFELCGGASAGVSLLNATRLCRLAESLGAVESMLTHPATMTHATLTREERERLGIADGLVRLSVGLEATEDILADLEQALERATTGLSSAVPASAGVA